MPVGCGGGSTNDMEEAVEEEGDGLYSKLVKEAAAAAAASSFRLLKGIVLIQSFKSTFLFFSMNGCCNSLVTLGLSLGSFCKQSARKSLNSSE